LAISLTMSAFVMLQEFLIQQIILMFCFFNVQI